MDIQWYFSCSDRHTMTGFVRPLSFCLSFLLLSQWVRYILGFSSNTFFCICMWTGYGGAFCERFQEMVSSWVHQWCRTVLQGKLCVSGCDWSYAEWLCMRALPKNGWRKRFPILTWKLQTHFPYNCEWQWFSCQTVFSFCSALCKGSSQVP